MVSCSQNNSAPKAASGSGSLSSFQNSSSDTSDQKGKIDQKSKEKIVDNFLALIQSIASQNKALERERDRRGKLQLELLGYSAGSSCMQDTPIEKMELIVDGESMLPLDVSSLYENTNGLNEFTDKTEVIFTVQIGSNQKKIEFENSEQQSPMFLSGLRKSVPIEDKKLTLGDLQFIHIEKQMNYHSIIDICQGQTAEACKTNSGYNYTKKIEEKGRYLLKRLRIKVNDDLIYDNDNIDFGFIKNFQKTEAVKSKGLIWEDPDIKLNDAYISIMQSQQCAL